MICLLSSDCGPPCPLVVVMVEVVVVVVVKWCQLTAQEDQGVGKVTRPIPISLSGTPAKKNNVGIKTLARMARMQNGVRDQVPHSGKQSIKTVRPILSQPAA